MISAFNALTLSPALSAMLLRPRKTVARSARALLRVCSIAGWRRTTNGYISLSHGLVRKPLIGVAMLALFALSAAVLGLRLPSSFLPEEDYGYALLNIQLPPAASLERTDAVARRVDAILKKTEGVRNFNTIIGFSLLTRVTASNNAFYFLQFQPWDERHDPVAAGARHRRSLEQANCGRRHRRRWPLRSCRPRFPVSAAREASRSGCRIAAAARSIS